MDNKYFYILLIFIVLAFSGFVVIDNNFIDEGRVVITPPPPDNPIPDTKPLVGTIRTGEQLNRDYCAEGYYLYIDAESKAYLLRDNETEEMMQLPEYEDTRVEVEVVNEEPRVYCEALICSCEERLLVIDINSVM